MESTVETLGTTLKISQDRHKVYADKKQSYSEFQVGDNVYM